MVRPRLPNHALLSFMMKPTWRWPLNMLAVISLGLLITVGIVWGAGLDRSSQLAHLPFRFLVLVGTEHRGAIASMGIVFYHDSQRPVEGPVVGPGGFETQEHVNWRKQFGSPKAFDHAGFAIGRTPAIGVLAGSNRLSMFGDFYRLGIPDWLAMIGLSVLPIIAWKRHWRDRKRRRLEQGLCVACGYDLRATPERCPECGTVVGIGT
jgi:hypothetical protein